MRLAAIGLFALVVAAALPARAEVDLVSRDTISGVFDVRVTASDGEKSWLDGGFGKSRFGGDGGHGLVQSDVVWSPRFAWSLGAVVEAVAQPGQHKGVDATQAYLFYKPLPIAGVHYQVRAGLLYPEISQEHEGYGGAPWMPRDTITPSAIDGWVGEEVHPLALEVEARRTFGDHELTATAAVFQQNDTAGALLATRGWALSDYQGSAAARLPLPPLNAFLRNVQPRVTRPVLELDDRTGAYARLDWKLPSRLELNAFYYDNRGDKVSLDRGLQWAWETRFANLGARYDLDDRTTLLAQAMTGKAEMGFPRGRSVWVDVDFSSAYLMATRSFGVARLSARMEGFRVEDNNRTAVSNYGEHGWAATLAWRRPLTERITVLAEAMHIQSDRPERALAALSPRQDQTVLQAALRFGF